MRNIIDREKSRDSIANQTHASRMISTKTEEVEPEVLSEPVVESAQPTLEQEALTVSQVFEQLETVAEPEVPVNPHPITQTKPVKKKGRPTVKRETKKRYTLTFLPSVYDKASAKACEQGKSLSEVVGEFLSEYIKP